MGWALGGRGEPPPRMSYKVMRGLARRAGRVTERITWLSGCGRLGYSIALGSPHTIPGQIRLLWAILCFENSYGAYRLLRTTDSRGSHRR